MNVFYSLLVYRKYVLRIVNKCEYDMCVVFDSMLILLRIYWIQIEYFIQDSFVNLVHIITVNLID